MLSYVRSGSDTTLDDGIGAELFFGYRKNSYAVEAGGVYADMSDVGQQGFLVRGLWFPFDALSGLYAALGVGALAYSDFPSEQSRNHSHTVTIDVGGGYMFPIELNRYDFAVRADARYRNGRRDPQLRDSDIDFSIPRRFEDVVLTVGLQLPLALKSVMPEPEPVAVVEPISQPDRDGDGVFDDADQCPGTPRGTEVDNVGCPLPPPPPPPACNGNADGQSIALGGCEAGETLVLRGVNFEFDKDRLTTNAKTLLGEVVAELEAHPDIAIEIAGHTDAKGSEAYNQSLSERRAQSVVSYLISRGIAQSRLTASGYGESQPIADNETEEGRELNRRVELTIAGRDEVQTQPETPAATDPESAPEPVIGDEAMPAPAPAPKSEGDNELEFLLN